MRLPIFSRTPEQMSLFHSKRIPLRIRLRAQLRGSLFWVVVIAACAISVLIIRSIVISILKFRYGSLHLAIYRYNGQEFLCLLWLALAILFLHLVREGVFGRDRSTAEVKVVVGLALAIYLFEITVAITRFAVVPSSSAPWSLYVMGGGLIALALWKLPAKQLAPWRAELEAKDYLSILNSTRTFLLQIIGGAIVISGLYYTSQNMSIAQENVRVALLKEEADRLNQAITQLKDENPEVRLVAIHNLQTLAARSSENYILIKNIFTRYVRTHATWKDTQAELSPDETESRADIRAILSFLTNRSMAVVAAQNSLKLSTYRVATGEEISSEAGRISGEVNLRTADLRELHLTHGFMEGWVLTSAHLEKASLTRCFLTGVVLDDANLADADLSYADLPSASLKNANLSGANLSYADLPSASLKNANLSGANLKAVLFYNTDVEGADFTDAINLTADQIREAKNFDKAKLPTAILFDLGKNIP
jgi:uncharacterized protein YjbI with pentapeptide repeats